MLFDGLSPIVCGVLGYVSIILYDLNNTSHNNDRMQSLHTVGAGLSEKVRRSDITVNRLVNIVCVNQIAAIAGKRFDADPAGKRVI